MATMARAAQAPLTRRSPAGEVVLAYVRDQVAAISRYDPLVRRDEPDAVHQMRVATRRARSALQAFGSIIEPAVTRPLCAELKWLGVTLGQARDTEVLLARLTPASPLFPPPWWWGRWRPASPPISLLSSLGRATPRSGHLTGSAIGICSMTWIRSWLTRP